MQIDVIKLEEKSMTKSILFDALDDLRSPLNQPKKGFDEIHETAQLELKAMENMISFWEQSKDLPNEDFEKELKTKTKKRDRIGDILEMESPMDFFDKEF